MLFQEGENMAREDIIKFFEELKSNKQAQDKLLAENPETLEDLAKVSGGIAETLGYQLSDDEILAFCNEEAGGVMLRSNDASNNVAKQPCDSAGVSVFGQRGCGAVQVLLANKG